MPKMRCHIALYGNVKIPRKYCYRCRGPALIVDGEFQCCGREVEVNTKRTRRLSDCSNVKKKPTAHSQKVLLERFDNSCAYCERRFGKIVLIGRNVKKLQLVWDHQLPWSYSRNNSEDNFLPACHLCNGWKSDRIFKDIDEVKLYVHQKWAAETISPL